MGKVYDALRRAETARSAGTATPRSMAPATSPHVERPLAPDGRRPGRLARLGARLRTRKETREDATAINKRRLSLLQPDSYVAEQFRTLRARLDAMAAERPLR